jgi:hypothetical protein
VFAKFKDCAPQGDFKRRTACNQRLTWSRLQPVDSDP